MSWPIWAIGSALFAAATALLAKLGVERTDSNLATAVRTSVVLIPTWLLAFYSGGHHSIRQMSSRTWLFLVLSGLATAGSWICYFRALQLGPASRVAPVDKMSVVFVVLFASLFLGERLTVWKVAGALLITLGAIAMALE